MNTKSFTFKEIDKEGHETLDAISRADKFNSWMYETIVPFCEGKTLEIGSGIGNISNYFLANDKEIVLSDIRTEYCNELKEKFNLNGSQVILIDIASPDFETKYEAYLGTFDTVFSLNVIEHIENHQLAIENCKKLLKKGGKLVTLVPAGAYLYNSLDKALEHYRRYNKKTFKSLLKGHFQIIHSQYFNFVGIFGWALSGFILKKKTIPGGQMDLYNKLVPIIKLFDKMLLNSFGLSVIVVGKKN